MRNITEFNSLEEYVHHLDENIDLYEKQIAELKEQVSNAIVPKFKVGQRFYYIVYQHNNWQIFSRIYFGENIFCVISNFCGYYEEHPKENLFATLEEAEQALEKLKEECV